MGTQIQLTAADSHQLSAYLAEPAQSPVGAVVLLQEIFGVNPHIRSVADRYAAQGFLTIAPALFDRIERDVELRYDGDDGKHAYELMQQLKPETALLDIAAAYSRAKQTHEGVAVVGFCFGGLMSWISATQGDEVSMRPDCAVCFYPGGIGKYAAARPTCPVMIHFGLDDTHIGPDQVEAVRRADHPEVQIFTYTGAQHGFHCDARASFNPEAASLANQRTLDFLRSNLA